MWQDYKASYSVALQDDSFVAWREVGARQKARNIVRVCRGMGIRSALEIGCGTGAVLRQLASMRFASEYVASDVSEEAIEFVRNSCRRFLNGAFVASAASLPFPDNRFSVAVLSHVIEHLKDPASAVREALRVAEYAVVEVPTEKVFSNFVRTKLLGKPYASSAAAGHLQFWSPASIAAFLEQACGVEIVARHTDLLSPQSEFHGRKGLSKAKPILKEALKSVIPGSSYARLLTTHATFLCRAHLPGVAHARLGEIALENGPS